MKEWNCYVKLRTPMILLPRDFLDFLRLLNANAIRYVVIGGYAVAYHGYVRYDTYQESFNVFRWY